MERTQLVISAVAVVASDAVAAADAVVVAVAAADAAADAVAGEKTGLVPTRYKLSSYHRHWI